MKGIIIYENDLKVINAVKLINASFCCKAIEDDIADTLEGTPVICKSANYNKSDTYDFETGALIALMKMCGVEKVKKAAKETFFDETENAVNEYEEKIHALEKENNYLKYIKSCRESAIKSLENTRDLLISKNNELIEENEKLQHDYDLCKNSENALKCSVDYLNKTIAKLNTAIYGYKEDLNKVVKRCEELEIKESILNKQEETINKKEEKISVYFGGRGSGKQYKALVDLFNKIPKEKVQAAYIAAYKESLIWCTSQPSIRDSLTVDSLIEQSKAFTRKCVDEWLYKSPTKREEMWEKIFALHKESDVVIKVKKEDVNTFLHEIENKIPEITWLSSDKIFETKYTIGDIYEALKTCDEIYFRLHKRNKLTYSSGQHIYLYRELKRIDYLPPMRWDLFKKGGIVVACTEEEVPDFREKVVRELEYIRMEKYSVENLHCNSPIKVYFHYDKDTNWLKPLLVSGIPRVKVNNHKVVYWEDVR